MYNEGKKAFTPSAAIAGYLLVMLAADNTVVAHDGTATKLWIGTTEFPVAADDHANVKLRNYPGTHEVTAAGAIDILADIYADADGKVKALPAGAGDYLKVGIALQAATADGDVIEFLPVEPAVTTVT